MPLTWPALLFPPSAKEVSCWHEIPLYAGDGLLHYICEIPKETSAKMEVATVSSGTQQWARWYSPWRTLLATQSVDIRCTAHCALVPPNLPLFRFV